MNRGRKLIPLVAALWWVAGCGDSPPPECMPGVVTVTVTYQGSAAEADRVEIDLLIDGNVTRHDARDRKAGVATDTIAVDLNTVSTGKAADISLTALRAGAVVGKGTGHIERKEECQTLAITINESAPPDMAMPTVDMARPDLSMPDLAMPDLAMPDLAMPDLLMPDLLMPDLAPVCRMNNDCMPGGMPPLGRCCMVNGAAACVNAATDNNNCGGCGTVCMGTTCCSGGCINTMTDLRNCGGCGKACTAANNVPVCVGGACGIGVCNANFADCDKNVANGCEVNLQTDAKNCGACGHACTPGAVCNAGVCQLLVALPGTGFDVQTADLNGDGKLDFATSVSGMNKIGTLSVILNNGGGTFAARVDYTPTVDPYGLGIADFNKDNTPDIISGGYQGGIQVLANDGKGLLTPKTAYMRGAGRYGAPADLDGDGNMDWAASDGRSNVPYMPYMVGNGDGTIKIDRLITTGTGPSWVLALDMNGDKFADIVTSNVTSNTVSVALNDGKGVFGNLEFPTPMAPSHLAAGDLNGDGKPDIVVVSQTVKSVTVLLNKGDGTLLPKTDFPANDISLDVVLGDFNGDGKLDALNGELSRVTVLLGDGKGGLGADTVVAPALRVLRQGDFDGDGHLDVAGVQGSNLAIDFLNVK